MHKISLVEKHKICCLIQSFPEIFPNFQETEIGNACIVQPCSRGFSIKKWKSFFNQCYRLIEYFSFKAVVSAISSSLTGPQYTAAMICYSQLSTKINILDAVVILKNVCYDNLCPFYAQVRFLNNFFILKDQCNRRINFQEISLSCRTAFTDHFLFLHHRA